eukprot:372279-Amphidinium_carterae.1
MFLTILGPVPQCLQSRLRLRDNLLRNKEPQQDGNAATSNSKPILSKHLTREQTKYIPVTPSPDAKITV